MNPAFRTLGVPPNAWSVNAESADISRPPLPQRLIHFSTDTKVLTVDLAKTACIVVDMQNDFCHQDGWLAHIGVDVNLARTPIGPLQSLLPKTTGNRGSNSLVKLGQPS